MSNELPYPPEKIWLQWHGDSDPSDGDPVPTAEVTWSAKKVWRGDVCYVRDDYLDRLREALKSLHAITEEAVEYGLSDTASNFDEWFREHRDLFLPNPQDEPQSRKNTL